MLNDNCKSCVFYSDPNSTGSGKCRLRNVNFSELCYEPMFVVCLGCKFYDTTIADRICHNPQNGYLKGDYFCNTYQKIDVK